MIEIREIGINELESAAEVIRKSFMSVAEDFNLTQENCPTHGAFLQASRLEKELSEGRHIMFGLFESGGMAGFCALEDLGNGAFVLEKLAVLPDKRHNGYGVGLMNHSAKKARELGAAKLLIGIIEENNILKDWYLAYGFRHTGTKEFPHLPFTVGFMEFDL